MGGRHVDEAFGPCKRDWRSRQLVACTDQKVKMGLAHTFGSVLVVRDSMVVVITGNEGCKC